MNLDNLSGDIPVSINLLLAYHLQQELSAIGIKGTPPRVRDLVVNYSLEKSTVEHLMFEAAAYRGYILKAQHRVSDIIVEVTEDEPEREDALTLLAEASILEKNAVFATEQLGKIDDCLQSSTWRNGNGRTS